MEKLHVFPPRYGPEWGSGGVFGLKFYKGVLYFTVAFEAEAHFVRSGGERVYRFEQVGSLPTSGGDTYNAVDVVDDSIYFGGWVHAPARYAGRAGRGGRIYFYDKFSHVHEYSIGEDRVRLLWKEGIGHESEWAGEISNIVYDPVNDRLLLSRADGHRNLGVYALPRKGGKAEKISENPSLKGALLSDYACFDVMREWRRGVEAIQCLDLVSGKWDYFSLDYSKISVDSYPVFFAMSGPAISAYGRYFHFVRGGVLVGNPLNDEGVSFVRMFDFGLSGYGPLRTTATPLGGGVLVAFNAFTHGVLYPRNEEEREMARAMNTIVGPSVLVYITPPLARIVGALGARVTSIENAGSVVYLGTSTTANYGALDAGPVDAGWKEVLAVDVGTLLSSTPPVYFTVSGSQVLDMPWGGIPLYGYREPRLVLRSSKDNTLRVFSYDFSLPPARAEEDSISIKEGRNTIDLGAFKGIVAFQLAEEDPELKAKVVLE
ncbi:DUF2139 domain-containing protein [Infirmifilum lucidum]|uniref:DUF2139 domain-containing protein n=1 Tax=Infirmifilum lucidum TaxID=2776706 RepID=A0A7L9FK94_9CREN|nr:DUF2139 domain-containing protein [Infirmifilum lucidum]QOJ79225.1 DUF2139 domain-containing protein [Infirmifilum lucidum]